jgi:serine protease
MASPHVAGAAALLMAEGVTDPDSVRAALGAGATPKDDASLYGAGILNAGRSVASVFQRHLFLRLGALLALFVVVARRIRKRNGAMELSPLAGVAALVGSVGLVPVAPYLGLLGRAGALRQWAELAARPFGEWDLALGTGLHRWLPLAGALPVLLAAGVFFGVRRLRPAIGGLALGTAALATQMAISGDVAFVAGTWAMRLYMLASVTVCLWIARIALDAKRG